MKERNNILLAFYGDDFTGSTDALEFLCRAGVSTVLFIEPPTAAQLAAYPDLDAFGVAGLSRSMTPAAMEQELLPVFQRLQQTGARHVHYKTCSTFDSSPAIGSIGKAIDIAATVFNNTFIPLLVAAPVLGRYCLFGNLFARMGIGSDGDIYRLDRHPSMSKHPVTPANESDLCLHLAKQTDKRTSLLTILQLSQPIEKIGTAIDAMVNDGASIILMDALYQEQLLLLGELIDRQARKGPLFSVGSSGIEMALGQFWNEIKIIRPVAQWPDVGSVDQLLVVSGSCSPVTAAQIDWALQNGFEELIVDIMVIELEAQQYVEQATAILKKGKSLIIHANGTRRQQQAIKAEKLGSALGHIARMIVDVISIKRIVVAGGDTSSYAARAMGIESVEMIVPLVPGAPLCKAKAPGSSLDGMEINFKGGQVGGKNYFELIKSGKL